MRSEFVVEQCYRMSHLPMIISGEVVSGEIRDGAWGITSRGKRCLLVKIEAKKTGGNVGVAKAHEKVNIYLKNIKQSDIKPGVVIFFD